MKILLYIFVLLLLYSCSNTSVKGWFVYTDSNMTNYIYEEDGRIYSHIKTNERQDSCFYISYKPKFSDKRDTLILSNDDSLKIDFFIKNDNKCFKINKFIVDISPAKMVGAGYFYQIYDIKENNYIYFDPEIYIKGNLFLITIIPIYEDNCCDSINTYTEGKIKYIYIKE